MCDKSITSISTSRLFGLEFRVLNTETPNQITYLQTVFLLSPTPITAVKSIYLPGKTSIHLYLLNQSLSGDFIFRVGLYTGGRERACLPMDICATEMFGFIFGKDTASGNDSETYNNTTWLNFLNMTR